MGVNCWGFEARGAARRESRRARGRAQARCYHRRVLAYYAKNLESGLTLAANERVVMPAWSTIKVLLALAFWRAVEEERLSAGYPYAYQPWQSVGGSGVLRGFRYAARITLADLAHLSLAVSDNDAANIVLAFVGLEAVHDLAAELGLEDTAMRRRMMDAGGTGRGTRQRDQRSRPRPAARGARAGVGPQRAGAGAGEGVARRRRSTATASRATCRRRPSTWARSATTRRRDATRTTPRSS